MQAGKAATLIRNSNGKIAAKNKEAATKTFAFKIFNVDNIPLNRISEISLKYIFVVGTPIPTPAPMRHLAISNELQSQIILKVLDGDLKMINLPVSCRKVSNNPSR